MGNISRHFSYSEFEKSHTAKARGFSNVIPSPGVKEAVRELTLSVLQPLRNAWGKPLIIRSGYRCPRLNAAVGGVPTSQHLKGEAADIGTATPVRLAQMVLDLRLPFDQMIVYPTFVHISHRKGGPQRGRVLFARFRQRTGSHIGKSRRRMY